jgi:hypothetical protein
MNKQDVGARMRALHPRVSVGNDTPCWLSPRRTLYGPTLDGKYHGQPLCRTFDGALKKAEKLSDAIAKAEHRD